MFLLSGGLFDGLLEIDERAGDGLCVLADPTIGDLLDGDRVEVVQLATTQPVCRDEVRGFQYGEMLHHSETRHLGELIAKYRHRLSVSLNESIE